MIEQIQSYAKGLNSNDEIMIWLSTAGKKAIVKYKAKLEELEHIVDYFISNDSPKRLQKMSFQDAKRLSKAWSEKNQKKGKNLVDLEEDIEIVHDFLDGTKIVKLLSKKALQREGFLMAHCVGGYTLTNDLFIYSYRDHKNLPHATFEVRKNNNEIVQIKGKGNGAIHPKYIHPILAFLKLIGLNINIRPSDMVNLGYYHIDKNHLNFLNNTKYHKEITMINGEAYAT